ncbi:MAG: DUF116 domain-containing protein [Candidatus Zhuqueibacterota bacterium]
MNAINDRKLGDEWEEWDGDLSVSGINVETGKRMFLGFAVLTLMFVALGVFLVWFLIKPRMVQLHAGFAHILQIVIYAFIGLLFLIFLLTVISIVTHRNWMVRLRNKTFSITFLTPLILALGRKFGVSYDRMGHSFIKVSNSLIQTGRWKINRSRIVILLPRCLRRPLQKEIVALARKYQCLIYTVPGGELARKIIAEEKPLAVIGVACERDLLSGIRDVQHIPVIGIPNQRPEGPCKNTTVDYNKIEEAIKFFMDSRPGLVQGRI